MANSRFKATIEFLVTAVPSGGTVSARYPAGTTQTDFIGDNAAADGVVVINNNDFYREAAGKAIISYGASAITITNLSGGTWPVGSRLDIELGQAEATTGTGGSGGVISNPPLEAKLFVELPLASSVPGKSYYLRDLAGFPNGGPIWSDGNVWRTYHDNSLATVAGAGPKPTQINLSAAAIVESAAIGTVVATISADGSPAPLFAKVSDPDNKFTVVGSQLILAAALDYETKTSHPVTISATNVWGTTSQPFVIQVANADDVAPVFLTSANLSVPENTTFSAAILTDETATLTIVGGSDQSRFSLVGNVLSMTPKDFEAPIDSGTPNNTYLVTIQAADPSGNTRQQTFTITVTDVVEGIPKVGIDEDAETDTDGVTDAAYYVSLHKQGLCQIVCYIVCSLFDTSPVAIRIFLDSQGLGNIPIGWTPRTGGGNPDVFATATRDKFGKSGETGADSRFIAAATLYRQMLVQYPGLYICTGGFAKPLVELMNSGPDGSSGLSGVELIKAQQPKVFATLGMRSPGKYTQAGAQAGWTNGFEENNTHWDKANAISLINNFPIPITYHALPYYTEFETYFPSVHPRAGNDPEIDPIAFAFARGNLTISGLKLNDNNGERPIADVATVMAALDDAAGVPTAHQNFVTGTLTMNADGTTNFTAQGTKHRIMTVTANKAALKTMWQGTLDALNPPLAVNLVRNSSAAFSSFPYSPSTVTQNNAVAPSGASTADTIAGSGAATGYAEVQVAAAHAYTIAIEIKKGNPARFPVTAGFFWNTLANVSPDATTIVGETDMVLNPNTGVGYKPSLAAPPGYGSVDCTINVLDGATALTGPNKGDYWVACMSFVAPAGAVKMQVLEQPVRGLNGTAGAADNAGAQGSVVVSHLQVTPTASYPGKIVTNGAPAWLVAA